MDLERKHTLMADGDEAGRLLEMVHKKSWELAKTAGPH